MNVEKESRDFFERVGDSPKINVWLVMTRWKIYGPFCTLSLSHSLSLSAEATVTGSIYLGRAAAVSMTTLSPRREKALLILQQTSLFFHQIKVF